MIKEVIRLFTGFDYGLRRERLIIPNHLVGDVDDVETVSDAKELFKQFEIHDYRVKKHCNCQY